MNPQRIFTRLEGRTLTVAILCMCLALCIAGIPSSAAQTEEREFRSTIPEHVPIKVKIKNEQSFKKMNNEKWARELEIEVENTGSKPIYYLYVVFVMPEMVNDYGHPLSFRTSYGRQELAFLTTPIQPEDVPIRPGESVTLKIPESRIDAFETTRHKEKVSNPKKVEFEMQIINFGDGTGLRGPSGRPYLPPAEKQRSSAAQAQPEGREFKSTIPEHVPIKVKVKNEQSFKMDNEKWASELEIEVKNTGTKPIYYLSMAILMPEMTDAYNRPLSFQVRYGRRDLRHLDTPTQPDDVPIRPGESTSLKVSENQVRPFEATRHKESVPNPKRVEFWLIAINLGDGTGFRGKQGSPETELTKKQSSSAPHLKPEPNACPSLQKFGGQLHPLSSSKRFVYHHPQTSCGLIFYVSSDKRHKSFLLTANFEKPRLSADLPAASQVRWPHNCKGAKR